MPDLPNPPLLAVDGDYEVTVEPGREYLLTLKGTWSGATITLTAYNQGSATFTAVDSGSWTANAEARLVAPSSTLRFTVTNDGPSTAVAVTLIPILK